MADKKPKNGDVFERVGPRPYPGGPEPGDRYVVEGPWETMCAIRAMGRTKGPWVDTVSYGFLFSVDCWKQINAVDLKPMYEVLREELAPLIGGHHG